MPLDPNIKRAVAPKKPQSKSSSEEAVDHNVVIRGDQLSVKIPSVSNPAHVEALRGLLSSIPSISTDELIFINKLKQSGELEKHMAAVEISSRSIRPDQIRAAIADMDQYTDAAEKHLSSLQEHMARNLSATIAGNGWSEARTTAQKAKEASLEEARDRLKELMESADIQLKSLTTEVLSFFESDAAKNFSKSFNIDVGVLTTRVNQGALPYDLLLSKLQGLGWEIKCDNADDANTLKAARHYASEEVFLLVRACRTSLDIAYIEAVRSWNRTAPKAAPYPRAVEDEIIAIKDEIQSLWDEVVPVAHMAVEKQLIEPILNIINTAEKKRDAQNIVIALYIGGCLHYMNERLTILASRLSIAIHHHESLMIACQYEHAVGRSEASPKGNLKIQSHNPRPAPYESALSQITKHIKQYGTPFDLLDPLSPPSKKVTKLNEFVQQRAAHGDDAFKNVHKLFESAIKAGIDDNELGMRMVLNCVTADSQIDYSSSYQALHDTNTEESIALLRQESQEIDALLAKLKLPVSGQIARALRTSFKHALQFLDSEEGVQCYHPENVGKFPHYPDGMVNCRKCQVALKQIDLIRRWAELPEFKDKPWGAS